MILGINWSGQGLRTVGAVGLALAEAFFGDSEVGAAAIYAVLGATKARFVGLQGSAQSVQLAFGAAFSLQQAPFGLGGLSQSA